MSDTTPTIEAEAGPSNAELLDALRALAVEITAAERVCAELYERRMALYRNLKARKVPYADIDEASGNRPGAARATMARHKAKAQPTA